MSTSRRASACRPRPPCAACRRLEGAGVITGYRAVIDRARLGDEFTAIVGVGLSDHSKASQEAFERVITQSPQVRECHNVTGTIEYVLRVETADLSSYKHFHTEILGALPQVRTITSYVVMGRPEGRAALRACAGQATRPCAQHGGLPRQAAGREGRAVLGQAEAWERSRDRVPGDRAWGRSRRSGDRSQRRLAGWPHPSIRCLAHFGGQPAWGRSHTRRSRLKPSPGNRGRAAQLPPERERPWRGRADFPPLTNPPTIRYRTDATIDSEPPRQTPEDLTPKGTERRIPSPHAGSGSAALPGGG